MLGKLERTSISGLSGLNWAPWRQRVWWQHFLSHLQSSHSFDNGLCLFCEYFDPYYYKQQFFSLTDTYPQQVCGTGCILQRVTLAATSAVSPLIRVPHPQRLTYLEGFRTRAKHSLNPLFLQAACLGFSRIPILRNSDVGSVSNGHLLFAILQCQFLSFFVTPDLLIRFTAQLAQFLRSGYFLSSSSLRPPPADVLLIGGFYGSA